MHLGVRLVESEVHVFTLVANELLCHTGLTRSQLRFDAPFLPLHSTQYQHGSDTGVPQPEPEHFGIALSSVKSLARDIIPRA
jgi:hypothetical protein